MDFFKCFCGGSYNNGGGIPAGTQGRSVQTFQKQICPVYNQDGVGRRYRRDSHGGVQIGGYALWRLDSPGKKREIKERPGNRETA
jgi:hypothetical protein